MLSIFAGKWKGRKLEAPDRDGLRPTAGRVKGAIFSSVESLAWKQSGSPSFEGWNCLDLFAGVGGLGLEALSRGASHALFVEKDKFHAKFLEKNISQMQAQMQAEVRVEAVDRFSWATNQSWDLVLMDPPYHLSADLGQVLEKVALSLKEQGILVFEHDPKFQCSHIEGLSLASTRILGPAGISIFSKNLSKS